MCSTIEYSEESTLTKCAAVFPVFRNRDKKAAIKEAWELEKQLGSSADYGIWMRGTRESLEMPPSSTSLRDLENFSAWFTERKELNDIHGVFLMLM